MLQNRANALSATTIEMKNKIQAVREEATKTADEQAKFVKQTHSLYIDRINGMTRAVQAELGQRF